MSSSSLPKPLKLKRTKSHLSNHFHKNNKYTTLPDPNYTSTFQRVEFNSQEVSSSQNKKYCQNGNDLPRRKTSRKERKQEWCMTLRQRLWLQDGEANLKRTHSNLPLWKRNNTVRIPSANKNKREVSTNPNNNLRRSRMSKG
jgi:hypothetical protein